MDERPRVLRGATDAGIILAGLCWLQSGGARRSSLGASYGRQEDGGKKTAAPNRRQESRRSQSAARKSPLPIGDKKVAAPNRRQESRRSQSATRKSPLPFGGKKTAAPAGEAQLEGDDSVSSNEYRYRLVFRNEKPRRR